MLRVLVEGCHEHHLRSLLTDGLHTGYHQFQTLLGGPKVDAGQRISTAMRQ